MTNFINMGLSWLKRIKNHFKKKPERFLNVVIYEPSNINKTSIGEYTYVSPNSIIHNTSVGKYCSIGPNVVIGFGDHPTNFVSTSPIFYCADKIFKKTYADKDYFNYSKSVSIGNDVWIGANVVIRNGLTIGNGAIIGAGSIVTSNVEPFSIHIGVPAKFYRMRFNPTQIASLLNDPWWDWSNEKILSRITTFQKPFSGNFEI